MTIEHLQAVMTNCESFNKDVVIQSPKGQEIIVLERFQDPYTKEFEYIVIQQTTIAILSELEMSSLIQSYRVSELI